MSDPNEGICPECVRPKIVALHEGKCYHHNHKAQLKERAKKGIPRESEKRAKQVRQYNKDNKEFAAQNATCAAFLLDKETGIQCDEIATDSHHLFGRQGERLTDFTGIIRLCRRHHHFVEMHPLIAKALGLSESRLSINTEQ